MKISKANPRHWCYLLLLLFNSLIAVTLRPFVNKARPSIVLLYGHKLSGNLLALYEYLKLYCPDEFRPIYLTMDSAYHTQLSKQGIDTALATRLPAARLLASARAILTDHGLHTLIPMLWLSNLRFFDVWHAIPFKGFDASDFFVQHYYTEAWVPSPLISRIYVTQYRFPKSKVVVTGYARTDALVKPTRSNETLRSNLGLDHLIGKRLVLFAPTWKQDAKNRSLFPFDCDAVKFTRDLGEICRRHGAALLLRSHLNASLPGNLSDDTIHRIPFAEQPDTEAVLQVTDVLICDWSSIAFDFILLDRPAIFLDVQPPFRKGFTLGPDFRYGRIVKDHDSLLRCLDRTLRDIDSEAKLQENARSQIQREIYGDFADGASSKRCITQLRSHLPKQP